MWWQWSILVLLAMTVVARVVASGEGRVLTRRERTYESPEKTHPNGS